MSSLLRVGSYNIMDGGEDRWAGQMELLASLDLDVLGIQEAKHWERQDHARLHATAEQLGMQALFAPSKSHGCHLVLFYRWPRVSCARFQPDISGGRFHHTASRALLEVDGLALRVLHTHLHPFAPSARLKEAGWLTEYASADELSAHRGPEHLGTRRPGPGRLGAGCGPPALPAPADAVRRQLRGHGPPRYARADERRVH